MDESLIREAEKLKKRSLKRYRKNLSCIKRLESKLADLEVRLTSAKTSNMSGMPRGSVPVTMADLVADKDDLVDRIKRLKAKGQNLKKAVYEEIDSLEDERYCEILEAYFIECLSIEDIAERMGYSERRIYTLYSEAISLLSVSRQ